MFYILISRHDSSISLICRSAQPSEYGHFDITRGLDPLQMNNVKAACIKGCHYDTQCKNIEVHLIIIDYRVSDIAKLIFLSSLHNSIGYHSFLYRNAIQIILMYWVSAFQDYAHRRWKVQTLFFRWQGLLYQAQLPS